MENEAPANSFSNPGAALKKFATPKSPVVQPASDPPQGQAKPQPPKLGKKNPSGDDDDVPANSFSNPGAVLKKFEAPKSPVMHPQPSKNGKWDSDPLK